MIIETCNRDTWMNQFFPNVAQRLCMIDQKWRDAFSRCFVEHVLEKNGLQKEENSSVNYTSNQNQCNVLCLSLLRGLSPLGSSLYHSFDRK